MRQASTVMYFDKAINTQNQQLELSDWCVHENYKGENYSHFHNILRHFDVLLTFLFTTSEIV